MNGYMQKYFTLLRQDNIRRKRRDLKAMLDIRAQRRRSGAEPTPSGSDYKAKLRTLQRSN